MNEKEETADGNLKSIILKKRIEQERKKAKNYQTVQ